MKYNSAANIMSIEQPPNPQYQKSLSKETFLKNSSDVCFCTLVWSLFHILGVMVQQALLCPASSSLLH